MSRIQRIRANERRPQPARYGGSQVEVIADPSTLLKSLHAGVSTVAPGTKVAFHYHSIEALEYILSGRAIVYDEAHQPLELGPGDAILFPPGPGTAHAWEIIGPDPCVILWTHPGPGEDQLTWVDPPPPKPAP